MPLGECVENDSTGHDAPTPPAREVRRGALFISPSVLLAHRSRPLRTMMAPLRRAAKRARVSLSPRICNGAGKLPIVRRQTEVAGREDGADSPETP
jgi:hypothetical protein